VVRSLRERKSISRSEMTTFNGPVTRTERM
jgi:hypothetical protein